ncbi:MAG: hypothetical protein KKF56_04310 [Nanoarchaeota archaeon]|nr:hypothetical protein [Nanoarchaeota archaeon]
MYKKRGVMNKCGQLQITFKMMFSIILIIAFVAVAIYAIVLFLNINRCVSVGTLKTDLQHDVDISWNSPETDNFPFEAKLSDSVEYVCFIDYDTGGRGTDADKYDSFERLKGTNENPNNVMFWPIESVCAELKAFKIEHLNIGEITLLHNPYCIPNRDGEVSMILSKDFRSTLVEIR